MFQIATLIQIFKNTLYACRGKAGWLGAQTLRLSPMQLASSCS